MNLYALASWWQKRNCTRALVYGIAIFGIIDTIPGGLKEVPHLIWVVVLYGTFGLQLVIPKRMTAADLLLLVTVLLSSIEFCIFAIDLVIPPRYTALDCQGQRETVLHGGLGFLAGTGMAAVLGYLIIRKKTGDRRLDRVCSAAAIAVLTFCLVKPDVMKDLNRSIDKVSVPEFVLPKGC